MPQSPARRAVAWLAATLALVAPAAANPLVVADVATGQVLEAQEPTVPWYPASLTKLMTTYVVLQAIENGKLRRDAPLVYSARAQAEPPSKMGFQVGQTVTVDDALKMLMVQSANDIAFLLAEGASGSVEGFVAEMNATARRIGMTSTNFVNPNGLPVRPGPDLQRTTARDMAVLATRLYRDFPQWAGLFSLDAIQIGDRILRNHNGLVGRYPGTDGMKTGYVCSSGFNVVATATRGSRRLVTVVLGAPTPIERSETAIDAFERGFAATSARGTLASLPDVTAAFPVDLREQMCGKSTAKIRAARKLDPNGHPWRPILMAKTQVNPVMVYATPAPNAPQVAAKPSGLDEDPPAFAPKASTTPALIPGAAVKPGSAKVKPLKAATPQKAKASAKAPKKTAASTEKKGRVKIELTPKSAGPTLSPGPNAASNSPVAVPGGIYRNAAPTEGKSSF
ncbi:D-alanyl-D-alanine carboxypeptidase family protein [Methylopila sp. Yamaguchi]|uniref:D-alanyl-D-alanine carboxypeptidase family protein n=1 Tax=Methylopila sp. Yamaguchi TaxID=1437817 RepID=UPI000CA8A67A|nr:D-alanyl-D-alanine carboxypeptidase family protein [Methylopila sp. Yamaguchi]GBD46992.1 D-alanyl-D-alanine carboxypeptidase [Methylopila sp. Yamaguchi]